MKTPCAQQQAQHLNDTVAESYALGYLGHLYETAQQWQEAETLTRQALAQAKNTPEVAYHWQWQLGRLLKAQEKPQAATNAYSACRTATGSNRAILGIAGAAIQAGTKSAIASLWSLDDQSSVTFTEAFYQHLGQPGVSRAEALRRAHQAMLQDANYQAPLFWAAYVTATG